MNSHIITRRHALATIAAAVATPRTLLSQKVLHGRIPFEEIEAKSKGRLGVFILFTENQQVAGHRQDELFPMCSTFKFLAAALVLHRVDQGKEKLDRPISISKADILEYAPATEKHVGSSMTVAELCNAAITLSDNTAANLLLASFGGPPPLTDYMRSLGDSVTRLDRTEPTLNESTPGDPRDTTSPQAMLRHLQHLLFGNRLKPASRKQLTDWMLANTTGKTKFVAGLPSDWKVADKTGSGAHGSNNDIGVLYPPNGKPILIASYLTETTISTEERNAIHADIARAIADHLK
jgi:beta-lactamase class A